MHVWLVFPVTGHPYGIGFQLFRRERHITIDKILAHIYNRCGAAPATYLFQPYQHFTEQHVTASHRRNPPVGQLHVKHRRKVAFPQAGLLQEIVCLAHRRTGGKEVIGSDRKSIPACGTHILRIIRIEHRQPLRGFDVHERDRIVHRSQRIPVCRMPQTCNAQVPPVYTVHPPLVHMLVFGNVDAVYPFRMVQHLFAPEPSLRPHSALDHLVRSY